jgi:ribosome maturation factor RimP
MIAKDKIVEIVNGKLDENMFLVDVMVSPKNVIHVELDCIGGLTVNQCADVSKYIENHLDRETEDFELEVSSPGIDHYFKVNRQYQKNIGRDVTVTTIADEEYKGKLVEAGESGISLDIRVREKTEHGKKQTVSKVLSLGYEEIKKAKVIISFK